MKFNILKNSLRLLFLLFILSAPFTSFGQFEIRPLVNENNFKADYYTDQNYVVFIIESKHVPFIYTDNNRNNIRDPYIDRLYSVINDNELCVVIELEDGATTTCGQATNAMVLVNGNDYQFIIPKKELTFSPKSSIYVTFGYYDSEQRVTYKIKNNQRAFVIY
jgi:hypothetical protein